MSRYQWARPLLAGAAALLTASALTLPAWPAAAAAELQFREYACQRYVCLVVVDPTADTDGDGITDVDEERLGTDPNDRASYPPVTNLLDAFFAGALPSFRSHLTEIVVLPERTPDGTLIRTGLGSFAVSDEVVEDAEDPYGPSERPDLGLGDDAGDRDLFKSIGLFTDKLRGFDLASTVRGDGLHDPFLLMSLGPPEGDVSDPSQLPVPGDTTISTLISQAVNEIALYSAEGAGKATSTQMSIAPTSSTSGHSQVNADGSGSHTSTQVLTSGNQTTTSTVTQNYDSSGNLTSATGNTTNTVTDDDGTTHTTSDSTSTTYDGNGNATGGTNTTLSTTKAPDGTTTGGGKTESWDSKGNSSQQSIPASTVADGGQGDKKYYDPTYVGFVITAADVERAIVWMNSLRFPAADEGDDVLYGEPDGNCVGSPADGALILVSPDGAVTMGPATGPQGETVIVKNHVQPDKGDPLTQDIIESTIGNGNGTHGIDPTGQPKIEKVAPSGGDDDAYQPGEMQGSDLCKFFDKA